MSDLTNTYETYKAYGNSTGTYKYPTNILRISYITYRKFLQKLQIAKSYRNPMYALQMSIGVLGIQKTPENNLKYSLQQQFLFLEALQKS